MKFQLQFKTPDVLDQLDDQCGSYNDKDKFVKDEQLIEDCRMLARTFIEYGEYIKIEFDTDTGTVTVLPL